MISLDHDAADAEASYVAYAAREASAQAVRGRAFRSGFAWSVAFGALLMLLILLGGA